MIRVTLRVYATLIEYLGLRQTIIKLPSQSTIKDLLEKTNLAKEIIEDNKIKPLYKVLINGRDIDFKKGLWTELADGDVIDIFPPLAGGFSILINYLFIDKL